MAKRWFIVDKDFDKGKWKTGKIIAYTLMDEDGKASYVRADTLREKMAKGFQVENLTLAKNGKLMPTSPKHRYLLPKDAKLLRVFTFDSIFPLTEVKYKSVRRVGQGRGVFNGLTITLRVACQTAYTVYGDEVPFNTNVSGRWLGISFQIPELNYFFKAFAEYNDEYRRYYVSRVLEKAINAVQ